MKRTIFSLLLLSIPVMSLAGNGKEARDNAQQAADNQQDRADDRKDHHDLVAIVTDWKRARADKDKELERSSDARLVNWVKAELDESRQESHEANHEARGSQQEARGEHREQQQHRAEGEHHQAADSHRDQADDRRDAADDRRDADQAQQHHSRTKGIATELRELQPKFAENTATEADYTKKASLLDELERMARGEKAENREEAREDAGERQEDKQERKEDRRRK